ncbi:MAG TPA: hypothetical protein VFQ63_01220 [Patescibacteria group bacterium]|nr:hypothetical protein [Patescibacteria group bacterium]
MKKLILFLFFVLLITTPVYAQDATPSAAEVPVNYSLPYPGILPDNPLYLFKALRDRLVSWFIADHKQQAAFDLLQADKRVAAAFSLSKEPKPDSTLILQTISKGENYFSESLGKVSAAKREGEDINGLLGQMENAAKKHLEIFIGISASLPSKDRAQLQQQVQEVQTILLQVKKLRSQ